MDSCGSSAAPKALQRAAVQKLSPPGSADEFPVADDHIAARENHHGIPTHLPAFVGTIVHVLVQGLGGEGHTALGIKTTTSASAPTSSVPLRGARPNAGPVRCSRPPPSAQAEVPGSDAVGVHQGQPVSMPGAPPGMREKSSRPACFLGSVEEGQWSVATVSTSPSASPAHRAVSVSFPAGRRRHHNLAPSNPGR